MRWNKRSMDRFGTPKAPVRPSCRSNDIIIPQPALTNAMIRDLLFGPKVVAELAILRRLAAA